tara:strand:- start:3334 stop:3681 length:348 start_codon:yes stop_codon:yes gene_type:complete
MAVYVSNIQIDQSTDFSQVFTLEDGTSNSVLNLTNYTFKSQMRKHPAATSGVTTFTSSVYGAAANGQVKIGLTTSQTVNLKDGRYVYDVIMTDNAGIMSRVVEGMVQVRAGATKF